MPGSIPSNIHQLLLNNRWGGVSLPQLTNEVVVMEDGPAEDPLPLRTRDPEVGILEDISSLGKSEVRRRVDILRRQTNNRLEHFVRIA
jgi:hypothetical protein